MTDPQSPDQKSLSSEHLWREYEHCRGGISAYDGYLFTIRTWHITVTAAMIAAFFGLNVQGNYMKDNPGTSLFIMLTLSMMFWLLDAFNKSLQMVHIHTSRDVERALRREAGGESPGQMRFSPTISLRFDKKHERHLRPTIKNLMDQSVCPFYIGPMLLSSLVVATTTQWDKRCLNPLADTCVVNKDGALYFAGIFCVCLLAGLSSLWRNRGPYRHLFNPKKGARAKFARLLQARLHQVKINTAAEPTYYSAFKADVSADKFLVFVDGVIRSHDSDFTQERTAYATIIGMEEVVITMIGRTITIVKPSGAQDLRIVDAQMLETIRQATRHAHRDWLLSTWRHKRRRALQKGRVEVRRKRRASSARSRIPHPSQPPSPDPLRLPKAAIVDGHGAD